jgi:hypothetical protein
MLRTEKSGEFIVVAFEMLPPLVEALEAGPTGELTFICGANGGPLTKESFGNDFSEACRAAGIRKSAHGVRKLGATVAAENGATEAELESMFGWKRGSGIAKVYTEDANRVRLAQGAANKMMRTPDEQAMPAPGGKVRASGRKSIPKEGVRK